MIVHFHLISFLLKTRVSPYIICFVFDIFSRVDFYDSLQPILANRTRVSTTYSVILQFFLVGFFVWETECRWRQFIISDFICDHGRELAQPTVTTLSVSHASTRILLTHLSSSGPSNISCAPCSKLGLRQLSALACRSNVFKLSLLRIRQSVQDLRKTIRW